MMPEVSVVIPFFNRAEWLAEAVGSVLAQTYKDFELIVVDDGSTEEVPPGLLTDPHVRYVRQENRGAAAARNRGIDLSSGRYVAFLDADDLFLPSKLERQVAFMDASNCASSHTSYRRMSREGEDLEVIHSGRFSLRIGPETIFDCHMIATPTVMIRREALGRLRFEESLQVGQGEDTVFWLLLATEHEIAGIDETLTRVRIHGQNIFFDAQAQAEAQRNVVEYAVGRNPNLSALPRKTRSMLYLKAGHYCYGAQNRRGYWKYLRRAVLAHPLNAEVHKALGRHLLATLTNMGRRYRRRRDRNG
jgi:glycosyltransferase involved in cell wall biosynthesis